MKITPALICDLICILLFALVVLRYMNRGFLADIVSFGGSALSLFGATYASKQYAQPIFDTMLRPGLEKNILQNITENGLDIAALAKKYGGFLPDDFLNSIVSAVSSALDKTSADAAQRVVELVMEPIFVPLISIVLFFVVFTLARFVVSLLVGLLTQANRIPLAGGMNKGLGAIVGCLAGALDLFLVYCAAWSLMLLTGGALPVLNQELFDNSLVLQLLGHMNPFV